MNANQYRLDPHVEIECSEGDIEVTTYEPQPIYHKYNIQEDVIVRNDTNFRQYVKSSGMIGPRSKINIPIMSIRQGKANKERYYADKT
ncbi:hypothetical protein I899_gp030 [Pelagibacter phage HTVC008M]|uniref:hypothetical protein n=1 Tax=Pelagibacter phage HTVC008M TaxID=1283076 RepID=UPI0002B2601D|nr:hypothetical protein I899_gp030 [Pelagibacter phage HTVC008M]AGE60364.1 hypothetical protein [Pelagibacter phage HTVC008M]